MRSCWQPILWAALCCAGVAGQVPPLPLQPAPPVELDPVDVSRECFAAAQWIAPGPLTRAPRATLWVSCLGPSRVRLPDWRAWLARLQQRFLPAGLRIAVLVSAGTGKAVASPPFAVGELDAVLHEEDDVWLDLGTGRLLAFPIDAALDVLQAWADDKPLEPLAAAIEDLGALRATIGDGGDLQRSAQECAARLPHCGLAQAMRVLCAWWAQGDPAAAAAFAAAGLKELAEEPLPLAVFADLVLRGDRHEPRLARLLAAHLGPVAAEAADSAFVQTVHLRALLRSGQDKLAARMVEPTAALVAAQPLAQLHFVETLMEAKDPAPFRRLAESMLDRITPMPGCDRRLVLAARHKVLTRSGAPAAEAEAVMVEARTRLGQDSALTLNNDAWYLMTRIETMGRFDSYALAQCEEMRRVEGKELSYGNKDTVALALFLAGRIDEAIELQRAAIAEAKGDPEYEARLRRYEATPRTRAAK